MPKKFSEKKYQITPVIWFIMDEATTKFHVHRDDYFGTVATILGLIRQSMEKNRPQNWRHLCLTLAHVEKDLAYLQSNYQIVAKRRK